MTLDRTFLILTLTALSVDFTVEAANLPLIDTFLAYLFDTTPQDVERVANNFVFIDVPVDKVGFFLHPASGNETMMKIDAAKAKSVLNFSQPIRIIIHGWESTGHEDWIIQMAQAYHQMGQHNVIGVDWSEIAATNYLYAATAVHSVGFTVGDFILNTTDYNQTLYGQFHVIGHSLGAHVSGFSGQRVQNNGGGNLGRITGLDPAGPLFEIPINQPNSMKLTKGDADFVDLLHTDMHFYGVAQEYGDVDEYFNYGGPIQPQCFNLQALIPPFQAVSCSHGAVHTYYTKSILNRTMYLGEECFNGYLYAANLCSMNPTAYLGEAVSLRARGTYYVNT